MRADDFLNEADEQSRRDKALAAAMANINKLKADIDARNAEIKKRNSENPAPAPKSPEYSIDDYKSLLARHDWYYDYSDDHSVWTRGSRERSTLYKYLDAIDPDYKIWNEYAPEMFQRKSKVEEKKKVKQRLDPKCWDGYKKDGTKIKGGVRVNNCVPK